MNITKEEVYMLIASVKTELRKEIWQARGMNYDNTASVKQNTIDNTDAILELAEIIGGNG